MMVQNFNSLNCSIFQVLSNYDWYHSVFISRKKDQYGNLKITLPLNSVGDPDPQDPHVFGPPGSASIIQRYGSGSPAQDPSLFS
jgi:hypothetical protein